MRVALSEFRNYAGLVWLPGARVSVVCGPNGSGKTNLLEAVSLLAPGRGLRGARIADLARQVAGRGPVAWAVAGRFAGLEGAFDLGTGSPPEGPAERRVFRLNGATPRSQAELAGLVAMTWLTPQMDRLVWALEPGHAREVAAHDAAVAGRNRLLAEGRRDAGWLAGIEDSLARHAVAVAAARAGLAVRLNTALAGGVAGRFPAAEMRLDCPIAARLAMEPALAVEDWLRGELAAARGADAAAGGTRLGAHRADMVLLDAASGRSAGLSSTGQQKALLVGVVLGHAALVGQARGFAPLLLLDEPATHLDAAHRAALFDALAAMPAQVLLTGTDGGVFAPLHGLAEGLLCEGGALRPDPGFP
ncbi:MAG TPA: DNA replication and repair protein RecF [Acetobacteraceae bacterium]|nr:DNA replication and repair protein RecF [Acetobacteraceae bacterium]